MKWIHIDIWFWIPTFRTDKFLSKTQQEDFEIRIASLLENCKHFINRRFYLYEDTPHCFIALELKHYRYIKRINQWRKVVFDKAPYIYKTYINTTDGNDENNGEGFLNIMNAFTDFYLLKRDNSITHIIHCCMEFILQNKEKESQFYQNMAMLYQPYQQFKKKVNLKLKKKLKRYINQLDLRRRK